MKSERGFSLIAFAHELAQRLSVRESEASLAYTGLATESPSGKRSIADRVQSWSGFREEGQALVEMALVVPVLLTAMMGILVFGIFTMQIMSLTQGISSAGNVLAVSAGQTLDPCALAVSSVQGAAPLLTPANLSYTVTLTPPSGSAHAYSGASCSSASTTTGAPGYLVSGGSVQVTATYANCSLNVIGKNFMPNGCSVSSTITEVAQ